MIAPQPQVGRVAPCNCATISVGRLIHRRGPIHMPTSGTDQFFDLTDRVALVTGGGRGIGRGIALALAQAGADVVVAARSADQLDTTAEEIRSLGRRSLAVPTNVSDLDQLAELFELADRQFGRLDILVNNAGIGLRTPALDVTPEEWDRVLNTNLRSLFFASQYGLRLMVRGGYGRVINTASLTSFLGFKPISVYGASKGGVAQLTKALAVEFAEQNITVNAIAPGYILTDLTQPRHDDPIWNTWILGRTPMNRWGLPEDLSGAVVFLASESSSFVSGHILPVDGAWLAA